MCAGEGWKALGKFNSAPFCFSREIIVIHYINSSDILGLGSEIQSPQVVQEGGWGCLFRPGVVDPRPTEVVPGTDHSSHASSGVHEHFFQARGFRGSWSTENKQYLTTGAQ